MRRGSLDGCGRGSGGGTGFRLKAPKRSAIAHCALLSGRGCLPDLSEINRKKSPAESVLRHDAQFAGRRMMGLHP